MTLDCYKPIQDLSRIWTVPLKGHSYLKLVFSLAKVFCAEIPSELALSLSFMIVYSFIVKNLTPVVPKKG